MKKVGRMATNGSKRYVSWMKKSKINFVIGSVGILFLISMCTPAPKSKQTEVKSQPVQNTQIQPNQEDLYREQYIEFKVSFQNTPNGKEMIKNWYEVGNQLGQGHEHVYQNIQAAMKDGCESEESIYRPFVGKLNCKVVLKQPL